MLEDRCNIDYLEEVVNAITESTQGQPSEDAFVNLFEDMDLKSTKLGREIKQSMQTLKISEGNSILKCLAYKL